MCTQPLPVNCHALPAGQQHVKVGTRLAWAHGGVCAHCWADKRIKGLADTCEAVVLLASRIPPSTPQPSAAPRWPYPTGTNCPCPKTACQRQNGMLRPCRNESQAPTCGKARQLQVEQGVMVAAEASNTANAGAALPKAAILAQRVLPNGSLSSCTVSPHAVADKLPEGTSSLPNTCRLLVKTCGKSP